MLVWLPAILLLLDATVPLVMHTGAHPALPWIFALGRSLPTAVWRKFPRWAVPQVLPPAL